MSDKLLIYAIKPEDQTFVAIRKKSDAQEGDTELFLVALCDCQENHEFLIIVDEEHWWANTVFEAYEIEPFEAEGEVERIAREIIDEVEILKPQILDKSKDLTDSMHALLELIGDKVSPMVTLKVPLRISPGGEMDCFCVDGTLKPKK